MNKPDSGVSAQGSEPSQCTCSKPKVAEPSEWNVDVDCPLHGTPSVSTGEVLWEFMAPFVGPTGGWLVSPKKFHAELVEHLAAKDAEIAELECWKVAGELAARTERARAEGAESRLAAAEQTIADQKKRIAELEKKMRWIPVGEELPALRKDVYCLLEDGSQTLSYREDLVNCRYKNLRPFHGKFDVEISNGSTKVTHWLPQLPAPPAAEQT